MGEGYQSRYAPWADEPHRSEKIIDTSNALYAIPKEVRRRKIRDGRREYVAFDAHGLLAEGDAGRPGHPFE